MKIHYKKKIYYILVGNTFSTPNYIPLSQTFPNPQRRDHKIQQRCHHNTVSILLEPQSTNRTNTIYTSCQLSTTSPSTMLRLPSTLLQPSIRSSGSCITRTTSVINNSTSSTSTTTIQQRALHLTPRETNHRLLHNAGCLAQYRLAQELPLNVPEARALIAMQMMDMVQNGMQPTVTSSDNAADGSSSSDNTVQ